MTTRYTLTRQDFHTFKPAEYRVLELLSDGAWHDLQEVKLAAGRNGLPASEGTRRLRALRPKLSERGFVIRCRRIGVTRTTEYQLIHEDALVEED